MTMYTIDVMRTIHHANLHATNTNRYILNSTVLDSIRNICTEMNIDFIVPRPIRAPTIGPGPGAGPGHNGHHNGQHNFLPIEFKKTEKIQDGPEKTIQNIRICLNKLSTKNTTTQTEMLFNYLDSLIEQAPFIEQAAQTVVDIASSNKFYSEIYAKLIIALCSRYHSQFDEAVKNKYKQYIESFNHICCADSEKDYDLFCQYNKENEIRRANTLFFMHLATDPQELRDLLSNFLDQMESFADSRDSIHIIDELSENVAILAGSLFSPPSSSILNKISAFAKLKSNSRLGVSSRVIFGMQRIATMRAK